MKFQFIRDHREYFPVRLMCQVLDASPSGFYDWLRRPESRRTAEDQALIEKIQAVHSGSRQTYGSPRVHASLKAEGYRIGRKRVARLMRENDIRARTKRKFRVTTDSRHDHPVAPNLCWTGSSRSKRRTRCGWRISVTSRSGRAGCIWPSCSTSMRDPARPLAGKRPPRLWTNSSEPSIQRSRQRVLRRPLESAVRADRVPLRPQGGGELLVALGHP